MRTALTGVAGALLLVLGVTAGYAALGGGSARIAPGLPGTPTYRCSGPPVTLLANSNTQAVQNGGTAPVFTTKGKTYCLVSLVTYHWNNGQGAAPGTIGLTAVAGLGGRGQILGPLAAVGSAGQGGAPNVDWTATASTPIVLDGTYACRDSDPSTWSQNQASGGHGFCTVTVTNAVRTKPSGRAKPTYVCKGPEVTLLDNTNGGGVQNGGKQPLFLTWTNAGISAYCLNSITTYHWNNGRGRRPGTIGLRPLNIVALLNPAPPRHATGSPGQGGAPNVNWTVDYSTARHPVVISGVYTCNDSDPATWSQDQASGGHGFCIVKATPAFVTNYTLPSGVRVPQTPPVVAPSGNPPPQLSHIKCFTGTLSTMLLYPIHIPTDTWALILLQCGVSLANGFQGRLAPSAVFVIDRGCMPFWTYPSVSGNPPPPVFLHYTGQPGSSCGTAKMFVPFVVRRNWRIDIRARDLATQAPLRPDAYAVFVEYAGGDAGTENTLNIP